MGPLARGARGSPGDVKKVSDRQKIGAPGTRFLALRLDRQHEVVCLSRSVLRALRSVCLRAGPGRQRVALNMRGVRDGILRGLHANEDSRL